MLSDSEERVLCSRYCSINGVSPDKSHVAKLLTSRLNIKSCTRFITFAIVASSPPSASAGEAKPMGCPFRRRPRDSRRLLMYDDAVRRLCAPSVEAIMQMRLCVPEWTSQSLC